MSRPRVLCVDDEPLVLEGLSLHLRRRFDVHTATSGAEALEVLRAYPDTGVVISDMRMPGMDGATFLRDSVQLAPDATRLLLTGHTDLDAAIRAVNDGQIFRLLLKPCPPAKLLESVELAADQHRLVTAEHVLLERTLKGSIATLVDVLALTGPTQFGRASRVKHTVTELADALDIKPRWHVEVAAMLSQLGFVSLPPEVAEKVHGNDALTDEEAEMVARAPEIADRLLAHIPRIESVRAMLASFAGVPLAGDLAAWRDKEFVRRGAALLTVATDFDVLLSHGRTPSQAVEAMLGRGPAYDAAAVGALARLHDPKLKDVTVRDLALSSLEVGMVLAEDLRLASGTLLAARGYEITLSFVERARNFGQGMVREPIRVILRDPAESAPPGASSPAPSGRYSR